MIKNAKDLLAAVIFAGIGLVALTGARELPFGTLRQSGPGFFPTILSVVLLIFAALLLLRAVAARDRESIGVLATREVVFILTGTLVFGLLIVPLGMVIALVATISITSLAERALPLRHIAILAATLTAGSTVLFVYLLKQPIPLFGPWITG